MTSPIWIVVFAAGYSRRMGRQKLLLPLEDNAPMVRFVIRRALASRLAAGVAVVHHPEFPLVWESVRDLSVVSVPNMESARGMSTSLKKGVEFLREVDAGAGVFLLGDQPSVSSNVIDHVIDTYKHTCGLIVQARYRDKYGHPVLFDQALYGELSQIENDQGGRTVIERNIMCRVAVNINTPEPQDIDTIEEYERYLYNGGYSKI